MSDPLNIDAIYDQIKAVLESHRMSFTYEDEDSTLPLVDMLCAPGAKDVETGKEEIIAICDAIYSEVLQPLATLSHPATQAGALQAVAWMNSASLTTFGIDRERYPLGGGGDMATARYMRSDHHDTPLYLAATQPSAAPPESLAQSALQKIAALDARSPWAGRIARGALKGIEVSAPNAAPRDGQGASDKEKLRSLCAKWDAEDAASSTATAAREQENACPDCHGSGAGSEMEGRGPDTHEVSIQCPRCNGSGTTLASRNEAPAAPSAEPFQSRVKPWLLQCFGEVIASDREERNHRFIEEALELVQACGCTRSEAHQLVDYVFDRPVGEKAQEVGGVMVTLAALCLAHDVDMHAAGDTELARIWTKVEQIRAKQAAKPKHSPLPVAPKTCRLDDGRCGICGGDWSVCGCEGMLRRTGTGAK